MCSESHFLAEIEADPNNGAAKLVYADWLEERGDPRAEMIQIREKLRTLSPLDTPYWDLKERFRELRDQQETDWLNAMKYDAVYRPMFTQLPTDRGQRWRLVEEFIDLWHTPLKRDVGCTAEEISAAEAQLEVNLPVALKELYRLIDPKPYLLVDPNGLRKVRSDQGEMLLLEEAPGDAKTVGVRCSDAQIADPKIQRLRIVDGEWKLHSTSPMCVSEFIIHWLLLFTHNGKFHHQCNGPSHSERSFVCNLPKVGLPEDAGGPIYFFFEGADYLVRIWRLIDTHNQRRHEHISVKARNAVAYQELELHLPSLRNPQEMMDDD
mgnify:CR=1 FL=1